MRFNIHCNIAGEPCELTVNSKSLPGYPNAYMLTQDDSFKGYIYKYGTEYRAIEGTELQTEDIDLIGEQIEAYLLRHSG